MWLTVHQASCCCASHVTPIKYYTEANRHPGGADALQGSSYPAAEEYDPSSTLQACEQLESTEAELQAQFLSDLAAMREEVEAAEKKLAAANAAVDAVSQVQPNSTCIDMHDCAVLCGLHLMIQNGATCIPKSA